MKYEILFIYFCDWKVVTLRTLKPLCILILKFTWWSDMKFEVNTKSMVINWLWRLYFCVLKRGFKHWFSYLKMFNKIWKSICCMIYDIFMLGSRFMMWYKICDELHTHTHTHTLYVHTYIRVFVCIYKHVIFLFRIKSCVWSCKKFCKDKRALSFVFLATTQSFVFLILLQLYSDSIQNLQLTIIDCFIFLQIKKLIPIIISNINFAPVIPTIILITLLLIKRYMNCHCLVCTQLSFVMTQFWLWLISLDSYTIHQRTR